MTTGSQLRQLAYDGRGNIASDTRSGIPLSLGYDAYGRLASYVAPSASMTMRYSGTDERAEAGSWCSACFDGLPGWNYILCPRNSLALAWIQILSLVRCPS